MVRGDRGSREVGATRKSRRQNRREAESAGLTPGSTYGPPVPEIETTGQVSAYLTGVTFSGHGQP